MTTQLTGFENADVDGSNGADSNQSQRQKESSIRKKVRNCGKNTKDKAQYEAGIVEQLAGYRDDRACMAAAKTIVTAPSKDQKKLRLAYFKRE